MNSIFGEGVNPLTRKIREGLSMLGLPLFVPALQSEFFRTLLDEVAKHTLVYPIQHGAQVYIPTDLSDILPLWS